jgi:hypothetical protein
MRRILRKIAANEHDLGDTSTLADPSVVDSLVRERMNRPADESAAAELEPGPKAAAKKKKNATT